MAETRTPEEIRQSIEANRAELGARRRAPARRGDEGDRLARAASSATASEVLIGAAVAGFVRRRRDRRDDRPADGPPQVARVLLAAGVRLRAAKAATDERPGRPSIDGPSVRAVLRVVLVVVAVVLTLVLMYLVRKPLTWIFIAAFLAIALSGPVNLLSRHMRRGFAVAIVYLLLILTPFALIGLLVPPIVTQANNLVQNLPEYAQEVTRVRQRQRPAAPAPGRLRHHRQARGAGREAAGAARRRRRRAGRHRRRARQLDLRRGDDHRALALHPGERPPVPRRLDTRVPARSRGVVAQPVRAASATRSATTSPGRCCRRRSPA